MGKLPEFRGPLGFSEEEAIPHVVILLYDINESDIYVHSLEDFYSYRISSLSYCGVES